MYSSSSSRRALVVVLLMTVIIISVLDKTIFAFAGPQIIAEMALTPTQFGFISSAFFFLYSISGVLVGFLANRISSHKILSAMALVWMSAQLLASLSSSFITLLVSRVLLGVGCGPATAVTQHACFKWYSTRERLLPAALIQIAIMFGAIAGALMLPTLIEQYGWRTGYLVLAGIGGIWLLLWQCYGREGQHDSNKDLTDSILPVKSYTHLLLNRTFICVTLVAFGSYLPNALLFSWLPTYLQTGLDMTPAQSGYLVLVTTLGVIFINIIFSGLAQRAMKRGASFRSALVIPPLLACLIASGAYILLGFTTTTLSVTLGLFLLGSIPLNLFSAFGFSIVAHISPARQRASILAIHIAVVTTAGVLAPLLVGQAIDWYGGNLVGGFELAIGLFGLALLAFTIVGLFLIDPERTHRELNKQTCIAVQNITDPSLIAMPCTRNDNE